MDRPRRGYITMTNSHRNVSEIVVFDLVYYGSPSF